MTTNDKVERFLGRINQWKHVLDLYEQMLVDAISQEPDEEGYEALQDELIEMLTKTTDGKEWNRYKTTNHEKKTVIQLDITLKFARYKKPKKVTATE